MRLLGRIDEDEMVAVFLRAGLGSRAEGCDVAAEVEILLGISDDIARRSEW